MKIEIGHGAGGKMSAELLSGTILPALNNDTLRQLGDAATVGGLAFTTDSYVVRPLFFPGGDIGKLAVCGTVNDLAVSGAEPKYLSLALIIEEGFEQSELKKILNSVATTARAAGVEIVTGDTKVVGRGQADGIYINTAGIGELIKGVEISAKKICAGMKIIISGTLGDHSTAVLSTRHGLELPEGIKSDCAPLNKMIAEMLRAEPEIAMMRDVTRGGLASVLNELAQASDLGFLIEEEKIPVRREVRAFCDILGFDPLELANEGKIVAIVPERSAEKILAVLRDNIYGAEAALIGEVVEKPKGKVGLRTPIGAIRIVDMPAGELVPRIC